MTNPAVVFYENLRVFVQGDSKSLERIRDFF